MHGKFSNRLALVAVVMTVGFSRSLMADDGSWMKTSPSKTAEVKEIKQPAARDDGSPGQRPSPKTHFQTTMVKEVLPQKKPGAGEENPYPKRALGAKEVEARLYDNILSGTKFDKVLATELVELLGLQVNVKVTCLVSREAAARTRISFDVVQASLLDCIKYVADGTGWEMTFTEDGVVIREPGFTGEKIPGMAKTAR